jgi:hypothetical protein
METAWPWLVLAGLGAFHGLNPAMGWLFAVALGLHRQSRIQVYRALPPIALGHALSIVVVAAGFVAAGILIDVRIVRITAGLLLIGWALYHYLYGHRHRVRVGMRASQAGLMLWSFLMATAHGAGLMILPAVIPLCLAASPVREITTQGSASVAFAAVAVHTGAMLLITGAMAATIYEWAGLAILRRAWVNLDLIWTLALAATGVLLIALV